MTSMPIEAPPPAEAPPERRGLGRLLGVRLWPVSTYT